MQWDKENPKKQQMFPPFSRNKEIKRDDRNELMIKEE